MQKNGNGTGALENRLDQIKDTARKLVDDGRERADQLKHRAIDVKDEVVREGSAALDKARALIKEHPFVALGIAFGVGYIAIRMIRN